MLSGLNPVCSLWGWCSFHCSEPLAFSEQGTTAFWDVYVRSQEALKIRGQRQGYWLLKQLWQFSFPKMLQGHLISYALWSSTSWLWLPQHREESGPPFPEPGMALWLLITNGMWQKWLCLTQAESEKAMQLWLSWLGQALEESPAWKVSLPRDHMLERPPLSLPRCQKRKEEAIMDTASPVIPSHLRLPSWGPRHHRTGASHPHPGQIPDPQSPCPQ